MRRIRSTTIAVLASTALAFALAGCQVNDTDQGDIQDVLIAADLELTGAMAQVGTAYLRALELRIEQVNRSGEVGNRRLRLDVRDNRSDPSESLRNVDRFTADPSVAAIIMGSCNDCAIGAARTVNDRRVPTIALASATAVASPVAERHHLFKLGPNAADSAAALVPELRRLNARRVGLLHIGDAYGQEGVTTLRSELRKADIRLVRAASVKVTDTDVSQPVAALTSANTDALIFWTSPEQAVSAAERARVAAYDGHLFFDTTAAGDLFLDGSSGTATDNIKLLFTQTMVIDDVIATNPAKAARKRWFRDYTARFGGYHGFSSFAADAIGLIVNALTRLPDGAEPRRNRDSIRNLLETSQMDGLTGPIRITPDNHSGLMPQALTMLVSRDGRWRLAS